MDNEKVAALDEKTQDAVIAAIEAILEAIENAANEK